VDKTQPSGSASVPQLMPVLSRGKHRNARKGACFMEMASVLAGERWSDHPRCTHPLLAELARLVNDLTSDESRNELAVLVPDVVGLTSDDVQLDARIALRCACVALPLASQERQNVLAVGLLTAEQVLTEASGTRDSAVTREVDAAFAAVPEAARWSRRFVRRTGISTKGFRRHAAPTTVRVAVTGIAEACVSNPDAVLRRLLTDVIADGTAFCGQAGSAVAGGPALVSLPRSVARSPR